MTALSPSADPAFQPVVEWRALQALRLTVHLKQAAKSPLYQGTNTLPRFPDAAISTANLDEILVQLPITTKDQLAAAGADAFAVQPEEFREWVCTSGTGGKPLDIPLAASDLERLAENEAAALTTAGVGRGDLFVMALAMDRMFVAGLAYWLGAQRLGAACLRVGPHIAAQPAALAELLARFPARQTFIITVPSFLAATAPPRPIAGIIAIGEAIRTADFAYNALGRHLHERFQCPILSTYANTETCTTFAEGPQCFGGHFNPNLALVEILDDSGARLPVNTPGEIVITPLGAQALPLVRFRTGDIAALHAESCPCGRTTPRLGPILSRRQHLLKIRGTSIFPNTILEALRTIPEVRDCVLVAERDELVSDRLIVHLCIGPDTPGVRSAIEARLRLLLRVLPTLIYTTPAALDALKSSSSSRKPQAFLDRRG